MTNTSTCMTCVHFEAAHNMCMAEIQLSKFGPSFSTRTADSPACWTNYAKQYRSGEMSLLFEQNRIQPSESMSS